MGVLSVSSFLIDNFYIIHFILIVFDSVEKENTIDLHDIQIKKNY